MEKIFEVTLKHGYANRVTEMLNNGKIPLGDSDILDRPILETCEVTKNWK